MAKIGEEQETIEIQPQEIPAPRREAPPEPRREAPPAPVRVPKRERELVPA